MMKPDPLLLEQVWALSKNPECFSDDNPHGFCVPMELHKGEMPYEFRCLYCNSSLPWEPAPFALVQKALHAALGMSPDELMKKQHTLLLSPKDEDESLSLWHGRALAFEAVIAEMRRQMAKWGDQEVNDYQWKGYVDEELGECIQQINDTYIGAGWKERVIPHLPMTDKALVELVQAVATGMSWLADVYRQRIDDGQL